MSSPARWRRIEPCPLRHPRRRGDGEAQPHHPGRAVLHLAYVFAVTQLSHLISTISQPGGDPRRARPSCCSSSGAGRGFYTWMANWFDPSSAAVRTVLTGVMFASLLMAAALPGALVACPVRGQLRRAAGRAQRRRGPSRARTRCAESSSGWSCGAPSPACCGWRARRSDGDQRLLLADSGARGSARRPRRPVYPAAASRPRGDDGVLDSTEAISPSAASSSSSS